MDMSDKVTRLLSDRLDRGIHIQMDLSAWVYPRKWKKKYGDVTFNIPGVTTVKQSQDGTHLNDTYSDARCQIPGVTTEKQKNVQKVNKIDQLEHLWSIWGFLYKRHLWGWQFFMPQVNISSLERVEGQ